MLQTAAQGGLHTREQIAQQANRMLQDPRARAKLRHFFLHWLRVDQAEEIAKNPESYPGFDGLLIADLRTSLDLFLNDVVWEGAGDYRQLLLADYLFLNDRLAKFYGVELSGKSGEFRAEL